MSIPMADPGTLGLRDAARKLARHKRNCLRCESGECKVGTKLTKRLADLKRYA